MYETDCINAVRHSHLISYALFSERFHHAGLEHYLQRIDIIFMFTLKLYGNARVHV